MRITSKDFERLWEDCHYYSVGVSKGDTGKERYLCSETEKVLEVDSLATAVYFFDTYVKVIMARHFLDRNGYVCQTGIDNLSGRYVILTNYTKEKSSEQK